MVFFIGDIFPLPRRLWVGKMIFGSDEPKVVRVSRHRLVKGPCCPPELEAMRYVAENTSIPVPKIHSTHILDFFFYIEMEFVEGTDLAVAWMTEGLLSERDKETIFEDIRDHICQLRELAPPKQDIVFSALQHEVRDCRMGSRLFGPLSQDDSHSSLRGNLRIESCAKSFGEEAAKFHTQSYRTCFTHADLIPRNIIVRGGRVVAIIDLAFSWWYPEYWEYTKAHYDSFPLLDW